VTPEVTLTDAPSAAAQAVIGNGLGRYNASIAGYNDSRPLAVLVADPETHAVVGGLLGRTSLGLLFVDLFFLPDDLRGHRPGFYERHGYRVFGTIPCDPPGTSRIFFVKELA
jgi:hypothetical protein